MTKSTLIDKLNWRYATKKMDPAKSVEQDKVDQIVEAVRMAPTSSGTQPFELFVVTNPDIRAQIRPHAWDQAQITEGSHLLVFAAWDNYSSDRIDAVTLQMTDERGEIPMLNQYYENLKSNYLPRDEQINHDHAARQAYIALGFALAAAAELEVDSTPMEGFDPAKVDEILGLRDKGLRSVVLLPLGYRQEDADWLLPMKKVRKSKETFVTEIA
ncbi:NAD(P)H-dependent oxidoreductase [Tropicibacter sp. Alg240-R139]|uniref:NAD(P)H-dependent oxidoreductase n=1 Tax=Tropicibacter sp. Alg240-R139 TaxID=2305991 RepID=UPI0013DEF6E4|nr:NAD(P)H-dependent oxidoreductase [Tropicibacter sp. Alg240-R139]